MLEHRGGEFVHVDRGVGGNRDHREARDPLRVAHQALPLVRAIIVMMRRVAGSLVESLAHHRDVRRAPELDGVLHASGCEARAQVTLVAVDVDRWRPGTMQYVLPWVGWATAISCAVAAMDYMIQGLKQLVAAPVAKEMTNDQASMNKQ